MRTQYVRRFSHLPIWFWIIVIAWLEIPVASAHLVHHQETRESESLFHGPCVTSFKPLPTASCVFEATQSESGDLTLEVQPPAHVSATLGSVSGQFGTDFPNRFTVTIPSALLTEDPRDLLHNFHDYRVESDKTQLCSRLIRQELKYDSTHQFLNWQYTTISSCSHDNYRAELQLTIQPDLTITLLSAGEGRSVPGMACPGGSSHGIVHQFSCRNWP